VSLADEIVPMLLIRRFLLSDVLLIPIICESLKMSEYLEDIKKYTKNVDEMIVEKIVKHLGIALQSRDASLVSCTAQAERARVRDSFLKKKLGLTASDTDLDNAVLNVCEQMKDTKNKSRVTFYYLLTEKFSKQSLFQ
jgi:hypothetical protein